MVPDGECQLADGRAVLLRPAVPDDVPAIARLYHDLSPESFHRRFHSWQPAPAQVAKFASLDGGAVSLLAVPVPVPGTGTGTGTGGLAAEARYVPLGSGTAELGLTVRDGYQGAGLGRLLLDALMQRARQAGVERLRAVVLLGNTPMLRLLQRYGYVLAAPTEDFSVACLEISAVGGMPGWPADSAGRRVLVERPGWFDDERSAALRSAGQEIRQCAGPRRESGRACPLVTSGSCRLAEQADLILCLLGDDDPDCAAVRAAHRQRWAHRLMGTSGSDGSGENPDAEDLHW